MNDFNFPPNTDPHTFSLIAVLVGFASCGNYTVDEQNSIGNWLILVGQYILTHAAQEQLIQGRTNKSNKNQSDIDLLKKALKDIQDNLDKFKKG